MGLDEEYQVARRWVQDELSFDVDDKQHAFEVTIRVLGGLLAGQLFVSTNLLQCDMLIQSTNSLHLVRKRHYVSRQSQRLGRQTAANIRYSKTQYSAMIFSTAAADPDPASALWHSTLLCQFSQISSHSRQRQQQLCIGC